MMEIVLPRSWREQFEIAAMARKEDIRHREKMAQFAAKQRQFTIEQQIEQKRREEALVARETLFLPPHRVAHFQAQLDRDDAATVEFLTQNGEALARKRKLIREILDQAHQLPDGRRVFKTEDGQSVFDEHGTQIGADVLAPDMIDDQKIRWERFKAERRDEQKMAADQDSAHNLQGKLDDARVRLKRGDITEADVTAMKADLAATAPEPLRKKLSFAQPEPDAAPADAAPAPALPPGTDVMMRQTGFAPGNGPG